MFEWKNLFRGMLIGASDLIPGVSGGTIAIILGIYDRLIEAISGFFSKEWKKHIGFLLPLAIGIGTILLLLSRAIKWLLLQYPQPTLFFFLGLILGVIPFLLKEVNFRTTFKARHYLVFALSAGLIAMLDFFQPDDSMKIIETLNMTSAIGLFLAGWLGSMAMLLPGISGSFVLLLVGAYWTAINALSTLNIPIIIVIGSGVIVGFIVSSKIIRYLLKHFHTMTYAVIIGLVVGSTVVIYPGIAASGFLLAASFLTFIVGIITAVTLGQK